MTASSLTPAELFVVGLFLTLLILGVLTLLRRPTPLRGPVSIAFDGSAAEWDRRLASVPQHADLRTISDRLHTVERTCDVVRAELGGVKDAVGRVEKMATLLMEHQLNGET